MAAVSAAEIGARVAKATKLADTIDRIAAARGKDPVDLAEKLTEPAWQAVAKQAGCRPPSTLTQQSTIHALRLRHPEVEPDPFEGLPR